MSIEKINEGFKQAANINSWQAFLIKYDHKKHPNSFICYPLKFEPDELIKNTVIQMYEVFLSVISKNYIGVKEYNTENGKNMIDKLHINNLLISECWNKLIDSINEADEGEALSTVKVSAYIFVGNYSSDDNIDNKNVYLITKRNPVMSFKRSSKIFSGRNNTVQETKDTLIQFAKCFDCVIYENVMYTINSNFETIFNLEHTYKKVCNNCLDILRDTDIISDIDSFKDFCFTKQMPKKFSSFSEEILTILKDDKNRKFVSKKFKIPLVDNKFDLSDITHAKNFVSIICDRTKKNIFDDGLCEVSSYTPIQIS